MASIADYTLEELQSDLTAWGYKSSHALPLLRRYYEGAAEKPWAALKLPAGLEDRLLGKAPLFLSTVVARQVAEDGTTKLLLRFPDGQAVESVMMPDFREDRVAGCLSSQAGCAMGCDFCATAQGGLSRNLSSGEIVEQFLRLRSEAAALGRRLRTLVFMGMGEPMHNLPNVLAAIRRIGSDRLGGFGWRQITVSTVGIVPGIDELAAQALRLNLAISLHAPDDATRAKLLPTGRRYSVQEILEAADRFMAVSGLPAIVQYCLLKDVNDSPEQARQLSELLAGRRMHVNLLQYNATGRSLSGRVYEPSPSVRMEAFLGILRSHRVVAHFRRPRGREIDAACGQLRGREERRRLKAEKQNPGVGS